MLLQRGHGSSLSGFFRVFSCDCSFSELSSLDFGVSSSSSSMEGVFGGGSASCSLSVTFSDPGSYSNLTENFV